MICQGSLLSVMARGCATRRSHLSGRPQLAVAVGLPDHNPVLAQVVATLSLPTSLGCRPGGRGSAAVIWIVVARTLTVAVAAVVVVTPFWQLMYMPRPVSTNKGMALLLLTMALEIIRLV